MSKSAKILELLRKIKEENDPVSKNELLSQVFPGGCKWAKKILRGVVYTDLINPYWWWEVVIAQSLSIIRKSRKKHRHKTKKIACPSRTTFSW